jgi:hypothetical protein
MAPGSCPGRVDAQRGRLAVIDFAAGSTLQLSGRAEVEWITPGAPGDDGGTGRRVRFTPHRGHDGEVWRPVQSEPGRGTVVRFDAADTVWRLGTRMISPAEAVGGPR